MFPAGLARLSCQFHLAKAPIEGRRYFCPFASLPARLSMAAKEALKALKVPATGAQMAPGRVPVSIAVGRRGGAKMSRQLSRLAGRRAGGRAVARRGAPIESSDRSIRQSGDRAGQRRLSCRLLRARCGFVARAAPAGRQRRPVSRRKESLAPSEPGRVLLGARSPTCHCDNQSIALGHCERPVWRRRRLSHSHSRPALGETRRPASRTRKRAKLVKWPTFNGGSG